MIVVGSSGSHDHGSSKVKLRNIVDYKWEVKHYNGRLVASHIGGKYVAYAIKGKWVIVIRNMEARLAKRATKKHIDNNNKNLSLIFFTAKLAAKMAKSKEWSGW